MNLHDLIRSLRRRKTGRNLILLKCETARAAGVPPGEKRWETDALLLAARRLARIAA